MKIVYKNNYDTRIDLTSENYKMLRSTDLFDYEWNYITRNEYHPRIVQFERSMVKKKITIAVRAKNRYEYNQLCNKLLETFEKDVYGVNSGKLIVNDNYYLSCYVVGKSMKEWIPSHNYILNEFVLISENGRWLKNVFKTFGRSTMFEPEVNMLDYPYGYMWDYVPSDGVHRMVSDSFVPFDFELVFSGAWENPAAIVGGHIYRVYTTLLQGEFLKINSIGKTIEKIKVDGSRVNEFHKRDRENYIFQKMSATNGSSYVEWEKGKILSISAFVERSEPKWT